MATYKCATCSKPISLPPSHRRRSVYIFCGKECRDTPIVPVRCDVCGNQYNTTAKGLPNARYCSHECKLTKQRERHAKGQYATVTQVCENCGNEYTVRASYAGKQRYCSSSCFGYDNLPSGKDNHKWKPKVTIVCEYCGKEFKTYPSRKSRAKYCCDKHRIIGNLARLAQNPRTGIEIKMASALDNAGIEYHEQVPMFNRWLVDFLLPEYRVVVECDGIYWHERPENRGRDKGQDRYMAKCGYRVLRFTNEEINGDIDACVSEITKHLEGRLL